MKICIDQGNDTRWTRILRGSKKVSLKHYGPEEHSGSHTPQSIHNPNKREWDTVLSDIAVSKDALVRGDLALLNRADVSLDLDSLVNTFKYGDGVHVTLDIKRDENYGGLDVIAEYANVDGKVARFHATLTKHQPRSILTGEPSGEARADAHLHTLEVLGENQEQGFGRGLMGHILVKAQKLGYKKVTFLADITIGRYAWAKMGFQYMFSGDAAKATKRFRRWCDYRGIPEPSNGWPEFKSPQDVATYAHPEGHGLRGVDIKNPDLSNVDKLMDLGKAFMLDMNEDGHGPWDVEMDL